MSKHALVGEGSSSGMRQTTITEQHRALTKSACDKLTSTVAKWIAKSCRQINIVEDEEYTKVLWVATGNSSIKAPQRRTILKKIHEVYEAETNFFLNDFADTKHVALTGDHWTSVSNDNYLGVTAYRIRGCFRHGPTWQPPGTPRS